MLQKIVAAAEIAPSDRILEIGPGTGRLTRSLLAQAQAVVAVEVDRDLCRQLVTTFAQAENFFLLAGDILELDIATELAKIQGIDWDFPNKVVANIPYYITGPILEKLLGAIAAPNPHPFDSIVLLVQREVAERLYTPPGKRAFGALSVRVQYLADCELICPVPAKAFQPPPKVESAVVRLVPRPPAIPAQNPDHLERLVKIGFSSKRKMLRNNLKSLVDRERLTGFMEALAIPPNARPEDLGVAQWVALSNRMLDEL